MRVQETRGWSIFKEIFSENWEGFKMEHSGYDNSYYEGLVEKMLSCGNPEEMGYIEYLCESCGVGRRLVPMSCKSTLCLRCGKVYVDNWVSQVGKMLHAGAIYRHIVLTMSDNLRLVFYKYSVELYEKNNKWEHLDYLPYTLLHKK